MDCLSDQSLGRRLAVAVAAAILVAALANVVSRPSPAWALPPSPAVFINEFHYDNVGADEGEGVELAGPAGVDLSAYSLELYNGYDQSRYATVALSGQLPDQQDGYGTRFFTVRGLQNGAPDGIALVGPEGVEETLGYEGSFDAADGAAAGQRFADIGQFEAPSTPVGLSLQLQGTGTTAADFHWRGPIGATPGNVNQGQQFGGPSGGESGEAGNESGEAGGESGETGNESGETGESEGEGHSEGEPGESGGESEGESAEPVETGGEPPAALPVNTSAPSISGTAAPGGVLTCAPGSWQNSPSSYVYEWREDGWPTGNGLSSLVVEASSEGHVLTCAVIAHNETGDSASSTSPGIEVQTPVPVSTAPPAISGDPHVGESLTCSTGFWEGAPVGYVYGWLRDALPIAEATDESYEVQTGDTGHLLSCSVVAWNAGGSGAVSASVAVEAQMAQQEAGVLPVIGEPPINRALPMISAAPVGIEASHRLLQPVDLGPSRASVAVSLEALLGGGWSRATAAWLVHHGSRGLIFAAPAAGDLEVRMTVRRGHRSTVVATGGRRFGNAAPGRFRVHPTPQGRKLLLRGRMSDMTEVATFTPDVAGALSMQTSVPLGS